MEHFTCTTCSEGTVWPAGLGQDTECETCGQEYNCFGQRLRSDWRGNASNWDDEVGDMEGFEIQHAGDW